MNTDSLFSPHHHFMRKAFSLAEQAMDTDEVPVGAVVVKDDSVIGRGYNQVEQLNDATAHAEMIALSAASATLKNKYLSGCTLYVTLEPCPMCAGALVWSKISRVVFGATDAKSGACGSIFNLTNSGQLNHQVEVLQGVMEADCEWLMKEYFRRKRTEKS